jgi:hypothetical protein
MKDLNKKIIYFFSIKKCKTFVEMETNKAANNWIKAQIYLMEW